MKNVNLNNVRGFEKIIEVRVDLSSLPKTGLAQKNNRIHTYTTVNNGTYYCLPTYIELIANGEKICCQLKPRLVAMDKFDKRYKCTVRDDILGNIVVWFDDLLQTRTFANRLKEEIIRHLKNIDELAKKIDEANALANENTKRATEYCEKYTNECMAHESTRYALNVAQNRVMVLEKKLDEQQQKAKNYNGLNNIDALPLIVKTVIKLYECGNSVDTIINKIARKLNK